VFHQHFTRSSVTKTTLHSSSDIPDPRQPRSYQERSTHLSLPSSERESFYHLRGPGSQLSAPSDTSNEGMSTREPSPVSPATPRSAASARDPHQGLGALSISKEHGRASETYPPIEVSKEWDGHRSQRHDDPRGASASRRTSDASSESHPHRPW
jgi:hypothetical protein